MRKKCIGIGVFVAALGLGCGEDIAETLPEQTPAQEDERETVRTGEEEELGPLIQNEGFVEPGAYTFVMTGFSFDMMTESGVAEGFDLDERISEDGDEETCGHADQVTPDGVEGIDNMVSSIFWIFKDLYGPQINELLSNAIQEGRLLIVLELLEVDDLQNDDNVVARWYRGSAVPQVDFTGRLLPSQTYYIDPDMEPSVFENVQILDGVLEAGPVDCGVPLEIFDADTVIQIRDCRIRLDLNGDPGSSRVGMLGGAVEVYPLLDELLQTGAASEAKTVAPFVEQQADLLKDEDGICRGMSVGAYLEMVEGYLVHYPE